MGGALDELDYDNPTTGLQGKFSRHHTVAWAVVNREVELEASTSTAIQNRTIQKLRCKFRLTTDPELRYDAHENMMRLTKTDNVHERTRENPPGIHEKLLPLDELRKKYEICAELPLDSEHVIDNWKTFLNPRDLNNIEELMKILYQSEYQTMDCASKHHMMLDLYPFAVLLYIIVTQVHLNLIQI